MRERRGRDVRGSAHRGLGRRLGVGLGALVAALAVGACTLETGAPSLGLALPEGAREAAAAIDEAALREMVERLSSDEFEGRAPGSRGDRLARDYIARKLQEWGYEPGGPGGSWEQRVPLVGIAATMPERWSFRGAAGVVDLAWWKDYIATSGVQQEEVSVEDAEVVFVGYGIEAPEQNWDDFKGADLRGKILLMLNNDPDWDPELFAGERRLYYGRWTYKYESAAQRGAAGAIIVHTTASAGYPWQVVQSSWSGEQFELPARNEARIRVAGWVTEDAARKLAALGGHDLEHLVQAARSRDFRPVPLGVRTSIRFTNRLRRDVESANVLGVLRGRDPELADEFVVYTAHHDHLGIGEPDATGDRVYNGARDNASGVAAVLGVARAFRALPQPPRRSVLILLVAAEEQGLLGSLYYTEHPTVPARQLVANINVDSPTIFGRTRDVAVIGRGKSSLEDLLEAAAAMQGRIVVDEPFPDKGYYYRSDQFNFAKIGVPALYFEGGTEFLGRPREWGRQREDAWRETRYHQPGDELGEDWDFSGLVEDARLAFYVGLAAGESEEPPRWRQGDEFASARSLEPSS